MGTKPPLPQNAKKKQKTEPSVKYYDKLESKISLCTRARREKQGAFKSLIDIIFPDQSESISNESV